MKKTFNTITLALAGGLIAVAVSSAAYAAGEHADHHKPQFGGIVAEGKAFDAEIVAKADLITVYVSEHGKPMLTKGMKGKVTLLSGTEKIDADLLPVGDAKLEAKGKFNIAKGGKVIVVLTPEGKTANTLRLTLK